MKRIGSSRLTAGGGPTLGGIAIAAPVLAGVGGPGGPSGRPVATRPPVPLGTDGVRLPGRPSGGVLTEIDVRATLLDRLGEQMEDYLILGACNPPLAHRALVADRRIGLLLPCNVVVRADGADTVVEALDPQTMVTVTGRSDLESVADEAARRLIQALETLAAEDHG